jgi:hypothetical protein
MPVSSDEDRARAPARCKALDPDRPGGVTRPGRRPTSSSGRSGRPGAVSGTSGPPDGRATPDRARSRPGRAIGSTIVKPRPGRSCGNRNRDAASGIETGTQDRNRDAASSHTRGAGVGRRRDRRGPGVRPLDGRQDPQALRPARAGDRRPPGSPALSAVPRGAGGRRGPPFCRSSKHLATVILHFGPRAPGLWRRLAGGPGRPPH